MALGEQVDTSIRQETMEYTSEWSEIRKASGPPTMRERVRSCVLSLASLASRPKAGPSLRLVYLHNVFKDQVVQFERQIEYLSSIGSFLTTAEVLATIKGEKPLDRRCFHLSFDDGFRNVITNALPVLVSRGIPGTFFVPSERISANFRNASEYGRSSRYYPRVIEMATWDDLGKAQEQGLEIASHTRSHARFSDISSSTTRMQDEIGGSKADIERELGRPCLYISWPFGTLRDADTPSLDQVKRSGYSGCFGAYRGSVRPGKTDPYSIPRHHFEAHWPLSHLKYFAHGAGEKHPE
jgi:peptidoglycan/xylan/chitin deacetylase (PgdA/CDA1 family)